MKKIVGDLVQTLSWDFAPTGCDEYQVLGELSACTTATARDARMRSHRQQAYSRTRKQVRATPAFRRYNTAAAQSRRQKGIAAPDRHTQYLDAIGTLLDAPTLGEFQANQTALAQTSPSGINASQLLDALRFIGQGFQYRYISTQDYLGTYNPSGYTGRSVDLMIANMVDFDWPLALGAATKTPLHDQIAVMERLSIYMRGRIHGFVPFDPMRQVAIAAGIKPQRGRDSHLTFAEIQDAVMNRGFLGVKLYPTMGFQPTGNSSLPASTWYQPKLLPDWMKENVVIGGVSRSFGEWMDDQLESLYAWAELKCVPITSHASPSNGPVSAFNDYAISSSWLQVLKNHPKLRLNFGHSGAATSNLLTSPGSTIWPQSAQSVLFDYICASGSADGYAYGDLSYPDGALADKQGYAPLLEALLRAPRQAGSAPLQERLMYGTDWLMVLMEPNAAGSLTIAEDAWHAVDQAMSAQTPSFSDRFFALNGIRWLGLAPGDASWTRLQDFYRRNGIDAPEPAWMTQVRRLTVPAT